MASSVHLGMYFYLILGFCNIQLYSTSTVPSESWLPMMFIFEADTCCSFHIKKKTNKTTKSKIDVSRWGLANSVFDTQISQAMQNPFVSYMIAPNTPSAFIQTVHQEATIYHLFQTWMIKAVPGIQRHCLDMVVLACPPHILMWAEALYKIGVFLKLIKSLVSWWKKYSWQIQINTYLLEIAL